MDNRTTNFRDPRIRIIIDEEYRKRFPPTPPTSTPYVPETPFLPSFSTPTNPGRHAGLVNDDEILDPSNMAIKNYKSHHFVCNFYQCFKTYPTEKFTREVHQNAVTVLKHVLHQQTEQSTKYKKERDQHRTDLIEKETLIRRLQINEQIIKEANEKLLQNETSKWNFRINELETKLKMSEKKCEAHEKLLKDYDDLNEDYLKVNDNMNEFKQRYEDDMNEKDECISMLQNENETLKTEIKRLQKLAQKKETEGKEELRKEKEDRKKMEIELTTYSRQVDQIKDVVNNWKNEEYLLGRKRAIPGTNKSGEKIKRNKFTKEHE